MESKITRILVVASSGTLAKFIINEVIQSFGIESLCISDYKADRLHSLQKELKEQYGDEPKALLIDITSLDSIMRGIDGIDYVIVPVSQNHPLIQKACIQKGIVCLDLSVSEGFIDDIIKQHVEAQNGKSLLLVAAGLFPGLSGIIAHSIHKNSPNAIVDIGLLQSKDGVAGKTGIADMLQLFNQKVSLFTPGKTIAKKGFSYSKAFQFDDRFAKKQLILAHFIERKYLHQRLGIKSNYWSAFDSEKFNKLIALLRAIGFLNFFENSKYRLMLGQIISSQKKHANEEVIGIIGQTDEADQFVVLLESDYSATAACAVAFLKILEQKSEKRYGVYFPFELFELNDVLQRIQNKVVSRVRG